jgi:hypothetical protein
MAYALQSMLRIRTMREDRAQTELSLARTARARQERVVEEKRRVRLEFEATKEERRDRLYDTIIGRTVSQDALDQVRAAVSDIDEEGLLLQADEDHARDELKKKDEAVEVARLGYVAAAKNKTKIEEHRRVWEEEDRQYQEMMADKELEDFTGRKNTDDELDDISDSVDAE